MESVLKNIYINKIQVPKFHGHVRLELRGCRETNVIEHDNHMTDALQMLLASNGIWTNPGETLKLLSPTLEKAFGSVLLVDSEIPKDTIMLPGGIEVVACAAYGVANSDEALTQGSYNTEESVLDMYSKKMTYVYDWTTNQGNGTIAAAALSHVNMGYAGFGDTNLLNNTGRYRIDMGPIGNVMYALKDTRPVFVNDEYIISVVLKNQKLTVYKYNSEEKIIYPIHAKEDSYKELETLVYEQQEFNIVEPINVNYNCNDGKCVYFISKSSIAVLRELNVIKLDTVNLTITSYTVKNNTNETWETGRGAECYNGKIYLLGKMNLYEIDLENPIDINAYAIEGSGTVYLNRVVNLQCGKIFLHGNCIKVFDCITKSLKNTKLIPTEDYNVINKSIKPIKNNINTRENFAMRRHGMCAYLATISNLDQTVYKTADKTMKVTYTIQQE